ncbi:MAG: hypothetical protein ACRDRH_17820 [Pseudonocardia sp.]
MSGRWRAEVGDQARARGPVTHNAEDLALLSSGSEPVTVVTGQHTRVASRAERSSLFGRSAFVAGEAFVAVGAAVLSVQLSRSIEVDPLDRIGQVSGLAALDLRFTVLGLLVLAACAAAARGNRAAWSVVSRLACAAVAGLATGLIAGGILLALRGTDWPLFASWGDSGQLIRWADDVLAGRPIPAGYPPVVIHLIAWLSELTDDSTARALRVLQVGGTAVFGPIAYLSWRLLLGPAWALSVALVAALPLLEPYKPYTTVVLVVLVPVLIAFLRVLRRAGTLTWPRVVAVGVGTGAVLGALFSVYSGWFVWSAPGALVATLFVFPWRTAALRGLVLLVLTVTGLAAVAAPHLLGLLRAAGTVQDRYFYFDTFVDPAYITMWRNDLPGDTGPWPPPGELAGVGVFTFLLVIGLGLAVALAGRRTAVTTLCALMAGAWVTRLSLASQMYATQSVQLYPRSSAEILYCLLLLSIFAIYFGARRAETLLGIPDRPATIRTRGNGWGSPRASLRTVPGVAATIGTLCAALLLALSIGSSVVDRYLPRNDGSVGLLAYVAQMVRQADGRCPDYSAPDGCAPSPAELLGPNARFDSTVR